MPSVTLLKASLLLLGVRAQHAELVALWIGHDHPSNVSLSDVDPPRTKTLEPLDFDVLVVLGAEIEVNSVLG